jgi:hypothetical protein
MRERPPAPGRRDSGWRRGPARSAAIQSESVTRLRVTVALSGLGSLRLRLSESAGERSKRIQAGRRRRRGGPAPGPGRRLSRAAAAEPPELGCPNQQSRCGQSRSQAQWHSGWQALSGGPGPRARRRPRAQPECQWVTGTGRGSSGSQPQPPPFNLNPRGHHRRFSRSAAAAVGHGTKTATSMDHRKMHFSVQGPSAEDADSETVATRHLLCRLAQ